MFMKILKRFHPVFRHFFTERHKLPMAWFSTRLNYARSVATTSIVGHVLGLGDRHVSNILIDNTTGEVVHIDFGIAFDQVGAASICVRRLATELCTGEAASDPRARPVPAHPGHGGRPRDGGHRGRVPALCRGDPPGPARRVRGDHDGARGLQTRPPALLVS